MTELQRCELAKEKGFTYDSITGEIRGVVGKLIKGKFNNGYVHCQVCINNKIYSILGHRLAWYLHYGKLPNNYIDHIDGCRTNNKIENLRDVTQQQNCFNNLRARGYSWIEQNKKFQAQIGINGVSIRLGCFDTEQDAHNAYLEAKKKYHIIN